MSENALSGHGTIIARENDPYSGTFTDIAELRDITLPALSRNEFDGTTQNDDIDTYVLGVLRRGAVTVSVNFIPTNSTHDHTTGLMSDIKANILRGYRFTIPTTPSWVWICSGRVQNVGPITAPVDGLMSADVTLRLTGKFTINGTVFG